MDVEVQVSGRPAGEQPIEHDIRVGDVTTVCYDWPGEGRPVLMAHGAGLHGRTWDAVARALPEHRVIAVDFRGHGRSDKPAPPAAWEHFVADLVGVVRALDLRDVIGVGHSMGGHTVTVAAAEEAARFAGLVLLDPIIILPEREAAERPAPNFDFLARRRNEWSGPEEMIERYRDRMPYVAWAPGVLEDYVVHGLVRNPAGEGYVLACAPAYEASTYGSRPTPDPVFAAAEALDVPVQVVRAKSAQPGEETLAFTTSPTSLQAASIFRQGTDVQHQDVSHFIPQEAPALVAAHVRAADARISA